MLASQDHPIAGPLPVANRLPALDILRGFALFGILVVNIDDHLHEAESMADAVTDWFISFFAEDSFYPLFAMLFGVGFAIQLEKLQRNTRSVFPIYLRRMIVLFLIGVGQYLFLEDRHILFRYAVLGLLLPPFRTLSPRRLLLWAVVTLAFSVVYPFLWREYRVYRMRDPDYAQAVKQQGAARREINQKVSDAEMNGDYLESVRTRYKSMLQLPSWLPFHQTIPQIFAMFLLGICAWRWGLIREASNHTATLKRLAGTGLVAGLIGNSLLATRAYLPRQPSYHLQQIKVGWFNAHELLMSFADHVGNPALTLFYVAGGLLLLQRSGMVKRLAWLGLVGRLGLTNYLMESVFMAFLFFGYGLGFGNQFGPAVGMGAATLIFAVLVSFSSLWLRSFEMGPAEWAWKSLTYWKRQKLNLRHR